MHDIMRRVVGEGWGSQVNVTVTLFLKNNLEMLACALQVICSSFSQTAHLKITTHVLLITFS